MHKYLVLVYEILTSLIPFLIAFKIINNDKNRNGIPVSKYQIGLIFVICTYIIGVYHFTGIGTIYDGFLYQLELNPEQINIIPFSHNVHITSYILNILLFVPMGVLIPIVCKKNKFLNTVGLGFIFTLFIELTQLLNNRITDIDDIIMNVLGTIIGFALFKIISKLTQSKLNINNSITLELFVYIVVITAGRFFFYNEIGFARLLFGF